MKKDAWAEPTQFWAQKLSMESQLAMPQTHLTHARSSSICRITNQYLKFADHCEDGPERPRKAPGINLALVWFPFSSSPSTEASGLSVYYVRLRALGSWHRSLHYHGLLNQRRQETAGC